MAMNWVRWYHGTTTDPKWRVVARKSGQPLTAVVAVWAAVLENASQSPERGTLNGWEPEDVAAALDLGTEQVEAIIDAMQGKVLDGDRLTGWEKRNPKREDDSTTRVRRYRERMKRDVTQGNAPETNGNAPDVDESKSKSKTTATSSVSIETGAAGAAPHVENSNGPDDLPTGPAAGAVDGPPSQNGADARTAAPRPPKRGRGPEPVGAAVAGALSLVTPKQDTERDILSRLMGEVRTWAYRDRRAPYGYDDGRDYTILRQWLRHGRTEAEITQAIRGARRLPGIGHVDPFTLRLLQDPDVWRHATELGSGTLDAAIPAEVKARIAEIMNLIRKAA